MYHPQLPLSPNPAPAAQACWGLPALRRLLPLLLLTLAACSSEPPHRAPFTDPGHLPVVYLQPLEGFPAALVDTVRLAVRDLYGIDPEIRPAVPHPAHAFTQVKTPRYRADSLIRWLRSDLRGDADYILGLTPKDISVTKYAEDGSIKAPAYKYADWGIFGLGFQPGTSCVVSIFRLRRHHPELLPLRLKKVSLHELGHNFGLEHCTDGPRCLMRDAAETIRTVDQVDLALCASCKKKIGL